MTVATTASPHIPVLMDAVIEALAVMPQQTFVDGTYGGGGYSRAIMTAGGIVHGFDQDPDVIAAAHAAGDHGAGDANAQLHLHHNRFSEMETVLTAEDVDGVDGITLDVGVSSMQLDQAERGFSFQQDGPLDMRMARSGQTAAEFLNSASEEHIADILYQYGDEKRSRKIAKAIVNARPIYRTLELAALVRKAIGQRPGDKKDPATRTFQAIRIYINRELGELEDGLVAAERLLKPGGRLAVVTFHSLEDRIVKNFLRERSGHRSGGSRHLPEIQETRSAPTFHKPAKAVRPTRAEQATNPRARSATLRSAVRSSAAAWQMSGAVQ